MPDSPDSTDPLLEQSATYVVQDRSNEKELARLQVQDQMMTVGMGGVLPEQADPMLLQRVLDVGCGTGNWLIEVAKTYPTISQLVGIDVSERMIEYANTQAANFQVADRVVFRAMDALHALEFPAQSFDIVNERFAASYVRTGDWPKILREMARVTRPGGVIRLTEGDVISKSTSQALIRIHNLLFHALYQAGHYFTFNKNGLTSDLVRLLTKQGFQQVQTRSHELEFCAGTVQWQSFYEDMRHGFQTLAPFFRKWTQMPDDYDRLCQQALNEILQPDFCATWQLLTAWGINPG